MDKENENTKILEIDLSFIKEELSLTNKPVNLSQLTKKLAYKKNASQLKQEVKKYDPNCKYEVGDLIYKDYDEQLMVSSKGAEYFKGAVVLKVVRKTPYDSFNCEMIEVDYTAGGIFRKHIDYMKKTKTQILLPCDSGHKGLSPEILNKEEDPRLHQIPMTEKDLKTLEKNLKTAISHSDTFFNWNAFWQLEEKRIKVPQEKIEEIKDYFYETKKSAFTENLVKKFFGLQPSNELFDLTCFNLSFTLEKEYKKNFILVSPLNRGKFFLKDILDSFSKNLAISAQKAKLPDLSTLEKEEKTNRKQDFPLKIYLTWREIVSGGLIVPKNLNKELSYAREYVFTDIESKKDYTVYYYPSLCAFLGLDEFYESNNVFQGASLTLEKRGVINFNFWLKKSKKKLSVSKISYNPTKDEFSAIKEEIFTFAHPNKVIHLENETLRKLFTLYSKADDLDLRELLILIFKNFGLEEDNFSLHYLRAFHLVDILRHTTQEDVEKALLSCHEFNKSEKKKGIFFYPKKTKTEEEIKAEKLVEIKQEEKIEKPKTEETLEIGAIEEGPPPEVEKKEEVVEEEKRKEPEVKAPVEIEKEIPTKQKKERKQKRKGVKFEKEIVPQRRKSGKKIIEEKIELEESEYEALLAVKAKEKEESLDEKKSIKKKKEKKEYKTSIPSQPAFSIFGDKLKSALDQKNKEKKKNKPK